MDKPPGSFYLVFIGWALTKAYAFKFKSQRIFFFNNHVFYYFSKLLYFDYLNRFIASKHVFFWATMILLY